MGKLKPMAGAVDWSSLSGISSSPPYEVQVEMVDKAPDFPDLVYAFRNPYDPDEIMFTKSLEDIKLKHGLVLGVYKFEKTGSVKVSIE